MNQFIGICFLNMFSEITTCDFCSENRSRHERYVTSRNFKGYIHWLINARTGKIARCFCSWTPEMFISHCVFTKSTILNVIAVFVYTP